VEAGGLDERRPEVERSKWFVVEVGFLEVEMLPKNLE